MPWRFLLYFLISVLPYPWLLSASFRLEILSDESEGSKVGSGPLAELRVATRMIMNCCNRPKGASSYTVCKKIEVRKVKEVREVREVGPA